MALRTSPLCATVVLILATVYVLRPVSGSVAMLPKVQTQASQMQAWKVAEKHNVEFLETSVTSLENSVGTLNATLDSAFAEVLNQAQTLEGIADELIAKLQEIQAGTATVPTYSAPPAFQAYIQAGGLTTQGVLTQPFVYSSVVINHMDAYDASTGLFTAPVNGLYWFYCTLMANTNARDVHIRKYDSAGNNREDIGYIYYYVTQETSATTIAYLQAGDTVGIYPVSTDNNNWFLEGGYRNGFAGYMIAAE